MVQIKLGNSYSQVVGLNTDQMRKLKRLLSYTPDNFFAGGFPRPKYLIDAKGHFPTGLLNRVKGFLAREEIIPVIIDLRIVPKSTPGLFKMRLI